MLIFFGLLFTFVLGDKATHFTFDRQTRQIICRDESHSTTIINFDNVIRLTLNPVKNTTKTNDEEGQQLNYSDMSLLSLKAHDTPLQLWRISLVYKPEEGEKNEEEKSIDIQQFNAKFKSQGIDVIYATFLGWKRYFSSDLNIKI